MQQINNKQIKQVAGGDAVGATIISATTGTATAIGTAIAGPVGAIIGAAIGSGLGTLASENQKQIGKGFMSASDTIGKHMEAGLPTLS